MVEIFVADSGRARLNPVTKEVRLDFEDKNLQEITIQLPLPNLRLLLAQAESQETGSSPQPSNNSDPLPLGGRYKVTALVAGKTDTGVRLTIHLESATGARQIGVSLSPKDAADLADDLLAKAAP